MEEQKQNASIPNGSEKPQEQIKRGAGDLVSGVRQFFRELVDLQEGLDKEGTIINIKNNKRMRGANVWLLICSIVIASLGLDLNSPAVIIGAMLISPLMSPILGVGLGIGINDKTTFFIALQHFLISVIIAILTSTLYFSITPFGSITPEIEARTAPTLLDVLVAFFGGLAGIISGSRKDKSNAIPGVAIATALMPPLCVTGFGLATQNWLYLFNSFYLFFLNASFVALATFLIVRYLQFPTRAYATKRENNRTRLILFAFSTAVIVPSIFILVDVIKDVQEKNNIQRFITENFEGPDTNKNAICAYKKDPETDTFNLKILLFDTLSNVEELQYREALTKKYNVTRAKVKFIEPNIPEFDSRKIRESIKGDLLTAFEARQTIKTEKDKQIELLKSQIDSITNPRYLQEAIKYEVKSIFPDLKEFNLYLRNPDKTNNTVPVPLAQVKWNTSNYQKKERQLEDFLKLRAKLDTIIIAH